MWEDSRKRVSDALDDRSGAHAAANAECDQSRALACALKLVERGAKDHRARRAERMAHGDRAAVRIDLRGIEVEGLQIAQHHGSESLVELDEVDVPEAHARFGEKLPRHVDRAGQHDRGLRTDIGESANFSARFQSMLPARLAEKF